MENAQFLRIRDRFDRITKPFRDRAKAKVERFKNQLATGGETAFMETLGAAFSTAFQFARLKAFLNTILAAFHSAVLVKFLGEGHGACSVRFRTNGFYLMEEGIIVNGVAAAQVA